VDSYRDEGPLSYLLTAARNIAINEIRDRHAKKRAAVLEPEEKLAGVSDDRIRHMEDVVQSDELAEQLRRAVQRLSPGLRACVQLYLADLSYEEIASSLALSVSAVKSRLHSCRKELRELMLEGFGEES
jgi:RNA polymerase sigma factor (sigma-70 family)